MIVTYNQTSVIQDFNKLLQQFEPQKTFKSSHFLGKIKWGEDALEFQKRIRDEWN